MRISSHFDSGAITVVEQTEYQGERRITLALRGDNQSEFTQWFHFRVQGGKGQHCEFVIANAGSSTYPDGWPGYQVVASYDRHHWFRIATTSYDGTALRFSCTPKADSMYFAYFEPYDWERHLDFLGELALCPGVRLLDAGRTIEGRDLNVVQIGEASAAKKKVWVIARQHPGESMAEWFCEGFLRRLTDGTDPDTTALLANACIYVVPNMNPDGAVRGNLRTNAVGANLNREWMTPTVERSPEVLAIRTLMHQTGCDLFIDAHGDEALPYVFVDGCDMLPGRTDAQKRAERRFVDAFLAASADFQTEHGYAPERFSDEILTLASKYVGHHFGCIALTLEMPFKDNANLPNPETGFDGKRAMQLGHALVQAARVTLSASC